MLKYDGCLDNVQITSVQVNLNKNVDAQGITSGCSERVKLKYYIDSRLL